MLQAFPTHHQNTSQRQGAILRTLISPDESTPYDIRNVKIDETGKIMDFAISQDVMDSPTTFTKVHSAKSHEIAAFLQKQLRGYLSSAYPEIDQKHIKLDSYTLDSQHILKLQMPATHLDAWLDMLHILEPFQEHVFSQNDLPTPFAFKLNSPHLEFEEGESYLRYKLANLKNWIVQLLPIVIEWTSLEKFNQIQKVYAFQDTIHKYLLPESFKAIKK